MKDRLRLQVRFFLLTESPESPRHHSVVSVFMSAGHVMNSERARNKKNVQNLTVIQYYVDSLVSERKRHIVRTKAFG